MDYTESNYQFKPIDSYYYILPDSLTEISGTKYDAATVKLGEDWRMPTKLEFMELCEHATFVKTTLNDVVGFRVIGPNGNCIFLPAAGKRTNTGLEGKEKNAYYWSGTVRETYYSYDYAYYFYISQTTNYGLRDGYRYYGIPIRPVKK